LASATKAASEYMLSLRQEILCWLCDENMTRYLSLAVEASRDRRQLFNNIILIRCIWSPYIMEGAIDFM
jgi:hypothetical protein